MNRKIILIFVIIFAVLFVLAPLSFSGTGKSGKASLYVSKSTDVDRKVPRSQLENKDGIITGGELHDYLDDEVEYMARHLYMREQHPQIMGSKKAVIVKYK